MAILIDCKAAAKRLCVAEGTLSNWRIQGRGPRFVRIGGKVCYRDEDIDAFIAGGLRQSTSEKEVAA
ncbi:hypothetical protein [Bradyrhizobium sp. McL0616]|uniref:hypothetical protein n=1 Tax=Bradyrhizobium sp. McL0616 TaxID=3415674 RepID=UPI003CF108A0